MQEATEALEKFSHIVITLSGGKDSTACLLWALNNFDHSKIVVVHQDSGVENPETPAYIKLINDTLIPVDKPIVKPFWEWLREIGRWPGVKFRWCTWRTKTEPMAEYLKQFELPLVIFGMRGLESHNRSKYHALEWDPLFSCCRFHPILDWDEHTAFSYIISNNFPISPAYNYASRVGCWCCPLGRVGEMVRFAKIHPETMTEGIKIETEIGHTWKPKISLAQVAEIAKSQGSLDIQATKRCKHFTNTLHRPLDSFTFASVTNREIEGVLKGQHPRGYTGEQQEEYAQLDFLVKGIPPRA